MRFEEYVAEHGASILLPADGACEGSCWQERPAPEECYCGLYRVNGKKAKGIKRAG